MNEISEITEKYLGLYKDNINKISGISSRSSILSGQLLTVNSVSLEFHQRRMRRINIPILTPFLIMTTIVTSCLSQLILLKLRSSAVR